MAGSTGFFVSGKNIFFGIKFVYNIANFSILGINLRTDHQSGGSILRYLNIIIRRIRIIFLHPPPLSQTCRYFHQKPWNHDARYLLILTYLQRAREERFPHQLCVILNRLIYVDLSNEFYSKKEMCYQYRHFQLLLCASEISLQCGNHIASITHAKKASELVLPDNYLFFAHLLLCRGYAIKGDHLNFKKEYIRCLELRTDCHIGWISLKLMECHYEPQIDSNVIDLNFEECVKNGGNSWNMWMAVYNLVRGMISFQKKDVVSAEEFIAQACLMAGFESCLFLCHGMYLLFVWVCNSLFFFSSF